MTKIFMFHKYIYLLNIKYNLILYVSHKELNKNKNKFHKKPDIYNCSCFDLSLSKSNRKP